MGQPSPLLHRLDAAIRNHPHLQRQHIFLERDEQHVVLRGKVDSFYRKQMIQEAVRKVDSAARINNRIEVK